MYNLPDFEQIYAEPRPRMNNQALILRFEAGIVLTAVFPFHDRTQPGPRRVHGFGEQDETVRLCLIMVMNTPLGTLTEVYSHSQSVAS